MQFYLAYLEHIAPMKASGPGILAIPRVSARSKESGGAETFDLALAAKLDADSGDGGAQ